MIYLRPPKARMSDVAVGSQTAMNTIDTIYALSSGALPSGVAVIRLSGPASRTAAEALVGPIPEPRIAALRSFRDSSGTLLDRGLVLHFPGPASFTGEDCVELHLHGGRATVAAVLTCLKALKGLRQADAGEFSRRAFQNGKLDLTAAEGLSDLIAAQTEMQRRLALEHAEGGVAALYASWSKRLTFARAMIEAELDFADEDDVPGSVSETIWSDMKVLREELADHTQMARAGEVVRDGLKVVIAGAPNVGKSSLINYLARRELAIVTDVPGTTRDILTIDIDLDGYVVHFYDTAGLRETEELVEIEGIRRAQKAMQDADLVLWVREAGSDKDSGEFVKELTVPVIAVRSKADLADVNNVADGSFAISTRSGQGVSELLDAIKGYLPDLAGHGGLAVPSRERHREELTACLQSIDEALQKSTAGGLEIAAEHLRQASLALGRLTGQVDLEALLDVIFSEFCVGK